MRLPISSGGNPQNNTRGLGSGERPARLTPERLVRNEGQITTRASQSTFGGDPRSVGHVWGNVGRAADKILGVLEREADRQRTRDTNTRNATNRANFTKWSTERLRINLQRDGIGFKGMSMEDMKSFDETFLPPEVLNELNEEDREHYILVAEQYKHDHVQGAMRIEDAELDKAELGAYDNAKDAILQDLKTRPGDKVAFSHAEAEMNEILTAKWLKENEGQKLTKAAEDAIRRDSIETIGMALRTQVEDAVAREEYELAMEILDGNDRIYFGDDYNELRESLNKKHIVHFGLLMGEEHDTLASLEADLRYQEATLREREAARKQVLAKNRGLGGTKFKDLEHGDLISLTHDTFGDDTIGAEIWLKETHGLNTYQADIILDGVDDINEGRGTRVARTDTHDEQVGQAVRKWLNGEVPNLTESYRLHPAEATAARMLKYAETYDSNEMPGRANAQYEWGMSTSLAELKGMNAQEFRAATLYATGEDRVALNHRYKAARWSRPGDLGNYTPADYAKIEIAARDMALQEGLSETNKKFGRYKDNMIAELKVALEPYSGIEIDQDLVHRTAREIVSRIPDFKTSSHLGGVELSDDWDDIKDEFDADPTPEQVRQAENFFPAHLRDKVDPSDMEIVMAAQKVFAASFNRPDIKQAALAEILQVRDSIDAENRAEYLDFIEGSNEPGYRGGLR